MANEHTKEAKEAKVAEKHTLDECIALWERIRVAAWVAGDEAVEKVYQGLLPIAEEIDPKEKSTKAAR